MFSKIPTILKKTGKFALFLPVGRKKNRAATRKGATRFPFMFVDQKKARLLGLAPTALLTGLCFS
jgi:hypothetical protein